MCFGDLPFGSCSSCVPRVFLVEPATRRDHQQGKKVTVVGDLHGQLFDFDHMLSLAGEGLESGPDDVGDIDAVLYRCC